jgi:DNA invertase Pin-like site-specific DNA recombinase
MNTAVRTVTVIPPSINPMTHLTNAPLYKLRVAAYARVSTDSDEKFTSYEAQIDYYTQYIQRNPEWTFVKVYTDEGISGTNTKHRAGFNEMIEDALAGKIDLIVTKSVSRFARNTVDCLDYVRMLKSKGIGVYFEEQQIDTLKTDSELYLVIYAGFAQSESESISKNITWSVRKKFEEGTPVFIYKRFLGYKKGADGEPEIVPSEAAIVERIFNLYLAGETVDNISKMMQAENYDIPGKTISFSKGMIMNMLSNERYCGDAILQKSVTVDCIEKKRKKNTGEAPMYYVQNNHPAIIDRVTFNKVQEELARRKTKTPGSAKSSITSTGKYSRYALTDVLICGNCGTRYRRVTWSRNGTKRIVWRCISRLDYGKKYCSDSPTIMEDKLQEAIVRAVNKFNKQDNATYKALMRATISEALGLNGDPEEVDMLERKIEALNNKMLALVNESVSSGDGIEAHESEFMTLSQEAELLKQRIAAIQESTAKDNGEQNRLEQIQAIIAERESKCMEYDDSIVRQMVECIKVYPGGKLEIIFGGGYLVEESV